MRRSPGRRPVPIPPAAPALALAALLLAGVAGTARADAAPGSTARASVRISIVKLAPPVSPLSADDSFVSLDAGTASIGFDAGALPGGAPARIVLEPEADGLVAGVSRVPGEALHRLSLALAPGAPAPVDADGAPATVRVRVAFE